MIEILTQLAECFDVLWQNVSIENVNNAKNLAKKFADKYEELSITEKSKWNELNRGFTNTFELFDTSCLKPDGTINEMSLWVFKCHVQKLTTAIYEALAKNCDEANLNNNIQTTTSTNYIIDILSKMAELFDEMQANTSMENIDRAKNLVDEFSGEYENLSIIEKGKWNELKRGFTNTFELFDTSCLKPDGTIDEGWFWVFKSHIQKLTTAIYDAIAKNS